MCFYADLQTGATGVTPADGTTKFGFAFFATGVAAGTNYELDGTWAVTAS